MVTIIVSPLHRLTTIGYRLLLDAVEDHATGCKAYVSSYDQRRFTLLTETFRFWQTLARMALLTPSDEAYRSVSRWHLAGFRHPMVLPAVSGRWREWVTKRIIVLPLAQLEAGQETFLPTVDG